ncbi:MAG: class I SAM-dependent methyltransferase [Pyrinomonadaceae bacterium]
MKELGGRVLRKVKTHLHPPIDITDDYIQWVSYSNAGMLERGNLYCFDYAIRHLPSVAPIIEIGSNCGLSTNVLTYYKEKHGVRNPLINCDKWEFEGAHSGTLIEGSPITHAEYREFVRETYMRNVRMYSRNDLPHTVEMLSDDFFAAWKRGDETQDVFGRPIKLGGPISFCYIDGNHTYDFARRDFEHTDEFLERGGFILFDDSADGSAWEVCRVVEEVKAGGKYEVVAKNPNYLFKKK